MWTMFLRLVALAAATALLAGIGQEAIAAWLIVGGTVLIFLIPVSPRKPAARRRATRRRAAR